MNCNWISTSKWVGSAASYRPCWRCTTCGENALYTVAPPIECLDPVVGEIVIRDRTNELVKEKISQEKESLVARFVAAYPFLSTNEIRIVQETSLEFPFMFTIRVTWWPANSDHPLNPNHHPKMAKQFEVTKGLVFKECASCAAKPGQPALCESCLNNREIIERLIGIVS